MKRTIYRLCPCGETAHDDTGRLDQIHRAVIFACRNCRRERQLNRERSYQARLRAALKKVRSERPGEVA